MRFINCILNLLSDKSLMLDPDIRLSDLQWKEGDKLVVKVIHGVIVLMKENNDSTRS